MNTCLVRLANYVVNAACPEYLGNGDGGARHSGVADVGMWVTVTEIERLKSNIWSEHRKSCGRTKSRLRLDP